MFQQSESLVFLNGVEKSSSILKISPHPSKNVIFITFWGGKCYPYRYSDVKIYENPRILKVTDQLVFKKGEECYGVQEVQFFHGYTRLIYKKGNKEVYLSKEIKIVDSALKQQQNQVSFSYLKNIAGIVGLKSPEGHNILTNRYDKIHFIRDDSIFADYLSGKLKENDLNQEGTAILPFGFNISQQQAVNNALTHKLSIIEGPPGTGKTQTILNIIANAVMRGESVAVVAGNNSATDNVLEKLKKYQIDFIAAPLGSFENKETFIEKQNSQIPDVLYTWKRTRAERSDLKSRLQEEGQELHALLSLKNELSELSCKLETLKKEKEHFDDADPSDIQELSIFSARTKADDILSFVTEYEFVRKASKLKKFIQAVQWKLKLGISFSWKNETDISNLQDACNREYYKRKLYEIQARISYIEDQLSGVQFDSRMKEYSALSMTCFQSFLYEKYSHSRGRKYYTSEDLFKNSEQFVADYPVILSTAYSLRSSLSDRFVYDYVIMDEASQVDIVTGALALSTAKKAVIVGDLKQLPNVVTEDIKRKTDSIFSDASLPEAYRYSNHSLLSSMGELFENVPRVLLREHYRCHPEIIGFCNSRFYNGQLIVLTKPESKRPPLAVYRTVRGNHARDHVNKRQTEMILKEVIPHENLDVMSGEIGIVTPYRAQADDLQKVFKGKNVKADTADKFQGQEKSVMIFSTVDNQITDFASDPNRLNVAVSRAIDEFIVVTDDNQNDETSPICDLISYIQYQNHEIIHSEINSVFDMLYKGYEEAREKAVKRFGKVSDFESENLMYQVIKGVLLEDEFSKYNVVSHVPIRLILKDLTKLDTRELVFATNPLSHVDFLIYSKLSHQPVLVIEVDGFAFHDKNEKQLERDAVKNSILEKYAIPILRFSTAGSGEKQKLTEALKNIGAFH